MTATGTPPALNTAQYSPSDVAAEVVNQGGSSAQAWVAAALVDGIESNGTLNDSNPSSTACGLFQFLTTTWISNGGGAYANTACGATLQQQVAVFLKASSGNNFYPWAPDLGGSYNGQAISAPVAGSPVANKISSLAGTDNALSKLLGNVPTNWADAGAVSPASPTPIPVGNNGVNVGASEFQGLTGLETGVDDLLGDLTSSSFWERVGLFAAGGVLVLVGIFVFISTTKTGQKVESDAAVAAVA